MAESLLSVSWKGHSSALATVCKTLLEDNFLVDCTISAEGQSVKAHRLILSACSPYFHMLFSEESEKYPIVILHNTPFGALKAVVNFMYHGETQIPEGYLQPFLALAESLQIKGLNNFPLKDKNKNLSSNTERKGPQYPFVEYEDSNEVQRTSASHGDCLEHSSHQRHLCHSGSVADASHLPSCLSHGRCIDSPDEVQRASVIPLLHEQQISLTTEVLSFDSEITVKHEPLHSEILEPKHEQLEDVESDEPMPEVCTKDTDKGTSHVYSEWDGKQYSSSDSDASHLHSSLSHERCIDSPDQLQRASVIPVLQEQQVSLITEALSLGSEKTVKHEPLHSEILEPKHEQLDDVESDEPMPRDCANDMDEGTSHGFSEHDFNQYSNIASPCSKSAHVLPDAVTMPQMIGSLNPQATDEESIWAVWSTPDGGEGVELREVGAAAEGREPSPPQAVAPPSQLPVDAQSIVADRPYKCDMCGIAFRHRSNLSEHKRIHSGIRPYLCDVCGRSSFLPNGLKKHMLTHTGERPYRCNVCGDSFRHPSGLGNHKRKHTGERPFNCDVCGDTFTRSDHLVVHKRKHTGERPFICDVCGDTFTRSDYLVQHKRKHTGERPFSCEVCGDSFMQSTHLVVHKRKHTGERPFSCDVCGDTFTQSGALVVHKRNHTGERPFSCDVCGDTFTQSVHLVNHKRKHTGERPFSCDGCGDTFRRSAHLVIHKRKHTGERPFISDVCGDTFTQSRNLVKHKRKHIGVRSFSCNDCGASFNLKYMLVNHLKSHVRR